MEAGPRGPATGSSKSNDMAVTKGDSESAVHKVPSNFAFDSLRGYQGLILHDLSPRLAERLYPYIATKRAEVICLLNIAGSVLISAAPLVGRGYLPVEFTWVAVMAHLSAFQRFALLETRILRQIFRQFDTWFIFGNIVFGFMACLSGFLKKYALVYSLNTGSYLAALVIVDALRLPHTATAQGLLVFGVLIAFWTVLTFFKLGSPNEFNYDAMAFGNVSQFSIVFGRMATTAVFYTRYAIYLNRHPGAYYRRNKTALVHMEPGCPDGGQGPGEPCPMHGLQDTSLLTTAIPSVGRTVEPVLADLRCEGMVMGLWLVGAVLSITVVLAHRLGKGTIAWWSLLLHVQSLHRLAMSDVRLLRRLLSQFDTLWLLANIIMGLVCVSDGVFTSSAPAVVSANLLISTVCTLVLDSVRLPHSAKLRTAALTTALLLVHAVVYSTMDPSTINLDSKRKVLGIMTESSVLLGRYVTLGIYTAKYAVKLWLRPDVYVVIKQPLMKHEDEVMMLSTLRQSAAPLE